ncbi:rab-3A-interacting protein isoform X2 [Erythrolamprus reginae]|uniref:rab-3A-interacting protein isoform X2 n=1 Tax=Erythrolamprus reginae TaxID=121349 RepID=UPI00396CB2A1
MANDTLEGFHEVNLASPTTPDLLEVHKSKTSEEPTSPTIIYRLHPSAVCSLPIQPSALNVTDLPTQPVYSSARHLNCAETPGISINTTETVPCTTSGSYGGLSKHDHSRKDNCSAEREFLQGATVTDFSEGRDDVFGLSTDSLSRLRSPSVLEVREKGYERLKEELAKAQRELKLKDEECERLSKVRDQLGQELEELTASLFEEAHKMVREANIKQATAEKQLKEAQGKADVSLYNEFKSWKDDPTMERTCPFLNKIYEEDIFPCLTFSKSELASAVLEAVENNTLSIEPVGLQPVRFVKASAVECGGPKKCALSGQSKLCKHRIKLGDSGNYYYISPFCRYRITSVCNFFTYIRYIQQGLVKQQDVDQMFWEVMQLRKEMSLAKLGYYREEL